MVAFWNIGYTYRMDATGLDYRVFEELILDKVETGDSISVGAGLAYALSYKISVNSSFSYSYQFSNISLSATGAHGIGGCGPRDVRRGCRLEGDKQDHALFQSRLQPYGFWLFIFLQGTVQFCFMR